VSFQSHIWLAASFILARRRVRETHMFGNELKISNVFVAPVACFELSKRRQVNKQRVVDALCMLEQPGRALPKRLAISSRYADDSGYSDYSPGRELAAVGEGRTRFQCFLDAGHRKLAHARRIR
jgi:hypothetical protein